MAIIEEIEDSDEDQQEALEPDGNNDIISILSKNDPNDDHQTSHLRKAAKDIILEASNNVNDLPTTLHQLLTEIIKPLFSTSSNPSLSSTGRKAHFKPPQPLGGFTSDILSDTPKPWQNTWTPALLSWILNQYTHLPITSPQPSLDANPSPPTLKQTLESHFFLLNPPILHHLDAPYPLNLHGLTLLTSLLNLLTTSHSHIHVTSNLSSIYTTTLTPLFHALPSLTPPHQSLQTFQHLYPCYYALIHSLQVSTQLEAEQHWTYLLRHGILYGLNHLSTPGAGLTTSTVLTTFLLEQLAKVLREMGVFAVKHFQVVLPFVRGMLCDPFIVVGGKRKEEEEGGGGLVMACLDVLGTVAGMEDVKDRVGERWCGEILRGVVGVWCAVLDEEQGEVILAGDRGGDGWEEVKVKSKDIVRALGKIVGKDDWDGAVKRLVQEEDDLKELFDYG